MVTFKWIETPLGDMMGASWQNKICFLEFSDRKHFEKQKASLTKYYGEDLQEGDSPPLEALSEQLGLYFAGKLSQFDLELSYRGTTFQEQVWSELLAIPYGKTRSYGEQAKAINNPKAVRAVANANGKNRIAIVIPCHRIIGSDGSLTGYAGGLERKGKLLELEGANY